MIFSLFLQLTVIACVSATDGRRVHPCLSSHGQGVVAGSSGDRGGKCLKVQSKLADIVRLLAEGECAGGGTGGRVAAGVARVPHVGGVGGDGRATGGAVEHTADSKASSTVAITTSSLRSAL